MSYSIPTPLICFVVAIATLTASNAEDLTRIIGTGDPIPESDVLTAGTTHRHPRMDGGKVAFFIGHEQFGVDKPTSTLLYWDAANRQLTKVADDFTALPGLPNRQLEFNDLTGRNTLSIDATFELTIVFRAAYLDEFGQDRALYSWTPTGGIRFAVKPGGSISHILSGLRKNGQLLFQTRPTDESKQGLYRVTGNGAEKVILVGDAFPDADGGKITAVQDFFFNGSRLVVNLNATIPNAGWWELPYGANPLAKPIWTVGDRVDGSDFSYWQNSMQGIGSSGTLVPSAIGNGAGRRDGQNSESLLYHSAPQLPFQAFIKRGDLVGGASGFRYFRFGNAEVLGNSVVFAANATNDQQEEISGLYHWAGSTFRTLIDSRNAVIDGKKVLVFNLHDRDPKTDTLLITAWFEDSTSALFTLKVSSQTVTFDSWAASQFPGANGNEQIIGLLSDPDRDKLANIIEFALGGNGNRPDPGTVAPSVLATPVGQPAEFEYNRRIGLPDGIVVTPQVSTSLAGQWQSSANMLEEVSTTPDATNPELERVRIRYVGPARDAAYFRISVTSTGE